MSIGSTDSGMSARSIGALLLRYWYLFLIGPALAIAWAYWHLRVTVPMYEVKAQMLIKEEKSYGEDLLFAELGIGKKVKNLENEVLVMLSSPLMADVVRQKNMQWRYFRQDGPVQREMYSDPPVRVLDWTPTKAEGGLTGEVLADGEGGYTFIVDGREYAGEFGGRTVLPGGKLILWGSSDLKKNDRVLVRMSPVESMVAQFHENLDVSIAGEESSILVLKLKDTSPNRAHDVLMGLIDAYNERSIDEKNKGYAGAIRLIDERLAGITAELSEVEQDMETFKSRNVTVELGAEASLLMNEMAAYDHKLTDVGVQLEMMDGIEDVLTRNIEGQQYLPTGVAINNVALSNELQSYNTLLAQRDQKRRNLGPDHPELQLLDKQIGNLRGSIRDNLTTLRSELRTTLDANRYQQGLIENRTRSLPRRERMLVEKERRRSVVQDLYLYLLQKREESAINMAVTTSTGMVVEPPGMPDRPVSPKPRQVWLVALFLGLAIPGAIVLLLRRLNDRVEDAGAIRSITSVPVLATIANSRSKESMVVRAGSNSVVAETFRLLRAGLMYLTPGSDLRTLLITSSTSGEGKSFIAMNLGMTLALAGKRIVILELDLRKPKQERYFGLGTTDKGVVSYLVRKDVAVRDIIRNSGHHPGLDVILSGPVPPDPAELILSDRLRGLVAELRESYDTIILDTPPVGLVADALQLKDLAQATMYVVRVGYTHLPQLRTVEEIRAGEKLPRPFIVLNGMRYDGPGRYGYGYGQGHGYFAEHGASGGLAGRMRRWAGGNGRAGAPEHSGARK